MLHFSFPRLAAGSRWLLLLLLAWAAAMPTRAQSWTQGEKLPAAPVAGNGYVRPTATATDAQGNVYAVGYFYGTVTFGATTLTTGVNRQEADFYVTKLSPTGQWLWAVQGGGAGVDYANDVVLNAAGEVYIAGRVGPNAALGTFTLTPANNYTNDNGFVAKLSAAGQFLWANRSGGDTCKSLALDASGNILVAGEYFNGAATVGGTVLAAYGYNDVFMAKLDATGTQWQWAVRAGSSGNDYCAQLGTDAAGNAYVLGEYGAAGQFGTWQLPVGNYNGFVTKISPAGQFVYATRLSSSNNLNPEGLVVDGPGNVYVTGGFRGTTLTLGSIRLTNYNANYTDGFVARLNPAGGWQWGIGFGDYYDEAGMGLALDGSGNLYATGALESPSVTLGSSTVAGGTGYTTNLFVGRLSTSTGAWQWATATGGYDDEQGLRLSAGPNGTVAVTGTLSSVAVPFGSSTLSGTALGIYPGMYVAQLAAANGTWQWAAGSDGGGDRRAYGTCADAQGNVYVAGTFVGMVTFGSTTLTSGTSGNDIFVAKRSPAGQWLWAARAGGNAADRATALAVDAAGNVYVTGYFGYGSFPVSVPNFTATFGPTTLTSAGASDLFVAKLDAAGQWQWATRAGGGSDDGKGFGESAGATLAATPTGEVFVSGINSGSFTYGTPAQASTLPAGSFVAGLSPAGQWRWVQPVSPGFSSTAVPRGLAADATGNVYLTGGFSGTRTFGSTSLVSAGGTDGFLARLDGTTGSYAWATRLGGTFTDEGYALALDAQGTPHLAGNLGSRQATVGSTALNNTGSGLFVARFTPAGQYTWLTVGNASSVGGVAAFGEAAALALDAAGTVYVAGQFQGSLALGSLTLFSTPDASGLYNRDLVVARLSPAGVWQQAVQSTGGTNGEYATGIALGAGGQPIVTGYTYSTEVRFGSTAVQGYSTYATGFLASPGSLLTAARFAARSQRALELYPNPAHGTVQVVLPAVAGAAQARLTLCDALGRVVRQQTVALSPATTLTRLSLRDLVPGVYVLKAQAEAETVTRRLVVE